jgi:hypothetical protein
MLQDLEPLSALSSLRVQLALAGLCDDLGAPRVPATVQSVLVLLDASFGTGNIGVPPPDQVPGCVAANQLKQGPTPLAWQRLWRVVLAAVDRHNDGLNGLSVGLTLAGGPGCVLRQVAGGGSGSVPEVRCMCGLNGWGLRSWCVASAVSVSGDSVADIACDASVPRGESLVAWSTVTAAGPCAASLSCRHPRPTSYHMSRFGRHCTTQLMRC